MLVLCVRDAVVFIFFFFQAEDGIRDLVRSRGLGDVYKRQPHRRRRGGGQCAHLGLPAGGAVHHHAGHGHRADPVSYTHLTLPTSDLV